jgi:hypothetical protein
MLPRSTRERLLPLLLVGALLLCHGVFGPLHQLSYTALLEHPAVERPSPQEEHGPADGHPLGTHDYAAAFFALLLWLVHESLRRKARRRDTFLALRRTGPLPTTTAFHLPRGPSPPLSQVFRL